MAVNGAKNAKDKTNANLPIIVIAVVALVAFMIWMGYRSFGPEPKPVNDLTRAHDQWMEQVAKVSGGDFSKVKPEDQAKLQSESYGHGDMVLKTYIKEHGIPK